VVSSGNSALGGGVPRLSTSLDAVNWLMKELEQEFMICCGKENDLKENDLEEKRCLNQLCHVALPCLINVSSDYINLSHGCRCQQKLKFDWTKVDQRTSEFNIRMFFTVLFRNSMYQVS
jgi:hypothetical protein